MKPRWPEGDWEPLPAQARFLACPALEAFFGGAAGPGKRLLLSTPIPTPTGWTTMGGLQVGDYVLDCDGRPTRVTWVSKVEHDPDAWQLTFDDGTSIDCDAEHEWVTTTAAERAALLRSTPEWRAARRAKRPSRATYARGSLVVKVLAARNTERAESTPARELPRRGAVRTTAEIIATLRVGKRANHAVENPAPLDLPAATLPIDPYVLGAWLGDGTSANGGITCAERDRAIVDRVAQYFKVRQGSGLRWGTMGLHTALRALGLLRNKHIPSMYLRGSLDQRVALLQGLCDTDGHATADGSAEFTTTSARLRDGMIELLATLGVKPACHEGRARVDGRDVGAKWRLEFLTDLPAFSLARKLARQKRSDFRGTHARRYIIDARRIDPLPMRCIAVDAPTSTYLAGRQMVVTHNSEALVVAPLRWINQPHFRGLLLRRTIPELKRSEGLIERTWTFYRHFEGDYHKTDRIWTFPSGARIDLGAMEHEEDVHNYDGTEYSFIGFDELTTFAESQYRYMFSRLRSSHGLPLRVRAGSNPGDAGHDWVLKRFAPWMYPKGHVDYDGVRARAGEVLYFRYDEAGRCDVLCARDWHLASCAKCAPSAPCGEHRPRGRVFFPAQAKDNPHVGDEYLAALDSLDPLTRAQKKHGDWLIKPSAGLFFKRGWFEFVDAPPHPVDVRVRYWDRAATPKTSKNDPDWTVGVRMSRARDGYFYVEHAHREQSSPNAVESAIKATAELDKPLGTRTVLERDPAQAGKFEANYYLTKVLVGHDAHAIPPQGDKLSRAKPVSAQCEARNVRLVRGPWNEAFINALEAFPDAGRDDVDALSGAFSQCVHGGPAKVRTGGERPLARAPGGF